MNKRSKYFGFTLVELMVVMGLITLLISLSLPALKAISSSNATGSARTMISAAMSSARAVAAKNHTYAGLRFQRDIKGDQYMICIIHDASLTSSAGYTLANGFRAVQGRKPTKLPDGVLVMDMRLGDAGDITISDNGQIKNTNLGKNLRDTTTFSIVFSPSGKLVLHPVRVTNSSSRDKVFNTENNVITAVTTGYGRFIQDNDAVPGLVEESSRNYFVICEKEKFESAYNNGIAYSGYLQFLSDNETIFINSYSGTIITEPIRTEKTSVESN